MDVDRFQQLADRLERHSTEAPRTYRWKVAALVLLGFGILVLLLGTIGLGVLLLVAGGILLMASGPAALLLLAKIGKLVFFLAVPLWYLLEAGSKALFVRLPRPDGRELSRQEAPLLFSALDDLRRRLHGPAFHHVLIVDDLTAAMMQRPAFGLFGWPRNYLLIGLPLLECMPTAEALAVVAHEYGHLAGAHSRFSGFVYRQRHTWATLLAHTEVIPGWAGRLVRPVMRWYVPYFNAYTFVMARTHEYQADAAAAGLVGRAEMMNALKRVNLAGPRHRRFLGQTFDTIAPEPAPPSNLMLRWVAEARLPLLPSDAERWIGDALDRRGHFSDSHPTLRARLERLATGADTDGLSSAPPDLFGETAAQAWLPDRIDALRAELQNRWADRTVGPWSERHAQWQDDRRRLAALRALPTPTADEQLETLQLALRLEPKVDLRETLAAFNAEHPDHVPALWLEACARLDREDRAGLPLIDRVIALDPRATLPACERACAFLDAQREPGTARAYAALYEQRSAFEAARAKELGTLSGKEGLAPHELDAATIAAIRAQLTPSRLKHVGQVYLARRIVVADPDARQYVLGLRLGWLARHMGRTAAVMKAVDAAQWPVPLFIVVLQGGFQPLLKRARRLPGSRLV